jgi:hypothetical protein
MADVKSDVDKNLFLIIRNSLNDAVNLVASPASFQVGLSNSPSDLTLMGRFSLSSKVYYATSENGYTINLSNDVSIALISIPIRNSAKVLLPSGPREGQIIFIKDREGICSSAPMVISASESLIDGASSIAITSDYGKKCLCWNTDRWSVISD